LAHSEIAQNQDWLQITLSGLNEERHGIGKIFLEMGLNVIKLPMALLGIPFVFGWALLKTLPINDRLLEIKLMICTCASCVVRIQRES